MQTIIEAALQQGLWAALYIYLFFRMLKENAVREEKYQAIVQATFTVATAQSGYPTTAFTATAHEALSDWSPSTLTYNNRPSRQNESLDYSSFAQNEGEGVVHGFNITNLV